jgi:hypothetical protein
MLKLTEVQALAPDAKIVFFTPSAVYLFGPTWNTAYPDGSQ